MRLRDITVGHPFRRPADGSPLVSFVVLRRSTTVAGRPRPARRNSPTKNCYPGRLQRSPRYRTQSFGLGDGKHLYEHAGRDGDGGTGHGRPRGRYPGSGRPGQRVPPAGLQHRRPRSERLGGRRRCGPGDHAAGPGRAGGTADARALPFLAGGDRDEPGPGALGESAFRPGRGGGGRGPGRSRC